jgi:hypothetical protein
MPVFTSTHGELRFTLHPPRVCSSVMTGAFDGALVDRFLGVHDEWLALGASRLQGFHDWAAMTDYDFAAHLAITKWILKHRHRIAGIHVLVRLPKVRLGIEVANFALGRILQIHDARPPFNEAFRLALQKNAAGASAGR